MDKKKLIAVILGTAIVVVGILLAVRAKRMQDTRPDEVAMNDALLAIASTFEGKTYLIPHKEMYDTRLTAENLPALHEPQYTSVAAMDAMIADDLFGIDIEVDGAHFYYPQQLMNWHRVVNDTFGDRVLMVTYDPLTGASVVYEARTSDNVISLEFSGFVYNNGMLLRDATGDLWWQMTGTRVVSSSGGVGDVLAQYPSQSMRWSDWKEAFPDGRVLSSETGYDRDYARHPYGNYESSKQLYFPVSSTDNRIGMSKWLVEGVDIGGEQLAISKLVIQTSYVYNTTLGGTALAAFYDVERDMVHVYDAEVEGRVLSFVYDAEEETFVDAETGTHWSVDGVAMRGELNGKALTRINAPEYYWFAWAAAHPDTRVAIIDEQANEAVQQETAEPDTNATE